MFIELVSATTGRLSRTWISPWQSHASCSQSILTEGGSCKDDWQVKLLEKVVVPCPKQTSPAFASSLLCRKFSTTQVPDLA